MTVDVKSLDFFHNFAGTSEVFDKYVFIPAFLLFLYFSVHPRREKLYMFWTTIASFMVARLVITPMVHFLYYRPHPLSASQLRLLISEKNEWPFPSGHAAFLFAVATAIYLYHKKWGVGFFIAAILLNISRVAAGVHDPSDIVGGAVLGVAVAYLIVYFAKKQEAKRDK